MAVSSLRLALAGGVGYLLGTVPTADIVSRAASAGTIDLRQTGSGNPGTVNAMQVLGKKAGAAVFAGDFAKGALAATLGRMIGGDAGACVAGAASVAGHNWPAWNGFRGGKGLATAAGNCFALFPAGFPIAASALAVGLVTGRSTRRAVEVAAPTWIGSTLLWAVTRRGNAWGPPPSGALVLNAAATSAMVLAKFKLSGTGRNNAQSSAKPPSVSGAKPLRVSSRSRRRPG